MAQLLYELQKARFLLIGGAALVVLFAAKSFLWSTPIELASIKDTRAGEDTSVTITADPKQIVELQLTAPDGASKELRAEMDEDGQIKFTIPGEELTQTGEYKLSALQSYRKISDSSVSFMVDAGLASITHSRISFSRTSMQNGETAQMSVLLQDDFGNPVSEHSLSVTPSQNTVDVSTTEFATNEKGQMNFTVSGTGNGVVSFNLFDSTEGQNILGTAQLAWQDDEDVRLAESGPIASFGVSGLSDETQTAVQQSITVKALDASGFTVTDYTGTIRFSSSDTEATLPDDYTFTADDLGEHTFSLSIKLVTPGTQSITVTDTDEITLTGSQSTTVTTSNGSSSSSSSVDYNSNFETVDFTRDGDFTLISPATGSYSTSTVEVQGEGEYGNIAVIMVNDEEAGRTDIAFDNSFTYSLENMKDGTYGIYVNIVDQSEQVLETSKAEKVVVDTTPPTLVSISADPEKDILGGSKVTVTLLSESGLESAAILFQDQVNTMTETSTPGKYQVDLVMPNTEGTYSLDVNLSDTLGNEAQYRDQLTLTVGAAEPTTPAAPEVGQVLGLTASGGPEKVALSWETPESATTIAYYRIYYGPSADALYAVSETYDSSTTWTIPGLTANQTYYFAVSAVNVEGTEGTQSETAQGVPELALQSAIPTPQPSTPAITTEGAAITTTPQTGPAEDILVILSIAGALSYILLRKRARA